MKQYIPKVKFNLPTVKEEVQWLTYFITPNTSGLDWSNIVYKTHPKLKQKLTGIKNKKKIYNVCFDYAKDFIKNNKKELEKKQKEYQKAWNKINDKYLTILSNHLETEWPKNKIIKAYISINPICPRFLDSWSFHVRYDKKEHLIPTCFHEILHFIYFKKWQEVFPKTNIKNFEAPHLIWKLSEIIDPIILNNNPQIKKMLKRKTEGYDEFKKIEINNKPINTLYTKMYKNHLKNKTLFDNFLKDIWQFTKENKNNI